MALQWKSRLERHKALEGGCIPFVILGVVHRPAVRWLAIAVAIGAFALLIALGNWQVRRLAWKEELIATIQARTSSPPIALPEAERVAGELEALEYLPLKATGTFLHQSERHFFATHQGRSGFYVYTPLRLPDRRAVFVNRGFVPYDLKNPALRPQGQVGGEVTVTGLGRTAPASKPSSLVPANDPDENIFYWKDLAAMTASARLPAGTAVLPFFLDADATSNPGGWPQGGVTIVDLPNSHLQYAVTWYGLAAALAGVAAVAVFRKHRAKAPEAFQGQGTSDEFDDS